MNKPQLTKERIIFAYAIAVIADVLEFPITGTELSLVGAPEGELAAFVLDCAVMGAMTKILGFHWLFLPSFALEVVPGVDLLPTWVGCVAFVISQRKKEQIQASPHPRYSVIDVDELKTANPSSAAMRSIHSSPSVPRTPAQAEPSPSKKAAIEHRLRGLDELHEKRLISQTEYDSTRRQILADI